MKELTRNAYQMALNIGQENKGLMWILTWIDSLLKSTTYEIFVAENFFIFNLVPSTVIVTAVGSFGNNFETPFPARPPVIAG
ncbi:unnamed protein product [Cylicocyclus nassatus]|uniref:Uncharacterized protein n=1 Tax=Cylicocyclus nassatus TaxID=53992 RepID=A0AA36HGX2_CYLNA|nr:unnamed protein product [Cylicocyclus nassatus]